MPHTKMYIRGLELRFPTKMFCHDFPIKPFVKHATLGRGKVWLQILNLNKLGIVPIVYATLSNFNTLGLVASDKNIVSWFPYISLYIHATPGHGHVGPWTI